MYIEDAQYSHLLSSSQCYLGLECVEFPQEFDEKEGNAFDANFALQVRGAGLTTAHLPAVSYKFLSGQQ